MCLLLDYMCVLYKINFIICISCYRYNLFAKFHALPDWTEILEIIENWISRNCVCLAGKLLPNPMGVFCTLPGPPNCNIMQKYDFRWNSIFSYNLLYNRRLIPLRGACNLALFVSSVNKYVLSMLGPQHPRNPTCSSNKWSRMKRCWPKSASKRSRQAAAQTNNIQTPQQNKHKIKKVSNKQTNKYTHIIKSASTTNIKNNNKNNSYTQKQNKRTNKIK